MLKKNLTGLTAFALVALAVPAFAGSPIGDYDDTFVAGSGPTLTVSSYDVDTEELSWFIYEAPEAEGSGDAQVASTSGAECRDTDDASFAYFDHLLD